MKKVYAMMALALGASLAAQAAAPVKSMMPSKESAEISTLAEIKSAANVNKSKVAPSRISSASDIYGPYQARYVWGLSNGDPFGSISPNIEASGVQNEVLIKNFPYSDVDIVGVVDVDGNKLILNQQALFYNDNYGEMVYLAFMTYDVDADGNMINARLESQVAGEIGADGTITFPPNVMISYKLLSYEVNSGYFFGIENVSFVPIKAFEFNSSEWSDAGTAMFRDGWLTAAYGEDGPFEFPAQEVKLMKHNTIAGDYLLVDPYGAGEYAEIVAVGFEGYNTPGYIRFNIADPDCVYVYPLVPSGAWMGEANGPGTPDAEFYMFNMEGLMIVTQGYSTSEVIDELEMNFADVSFYDGETAVIYNPYFGLTGQMLTPYLWSDGAGGSIWSYSEITFDAAGVEGIVDNTNAPVKYFNLQGVEIANPAKGQIVIKTQGNKATKYVVR